jgi:hypothetical protein
MTTPGLSRRRVPASTSPVPGATSTLSSPTPPQPNGSSLPVNPVSSHAGSAFEGGSKIAYDPRDLEQDEEESKTGGRIPRLTLMEEVLLLGIKDKQVRDELRLYLWPTAMLLGLPIVLVDQTTSALAGGRLYIPSTFTLTLVPVLYSLC